ncbi:MAG: AAA family ATPase [Bacteroidetes bacterium]|nr:AAA family ATPase [Bacteroidota bacterium]
MDFLYLFKVLLKRKWLILGAAVLASVVAWTFTRNQPKKYRSQAQVSTGFTVNEEIKITNDNFSFYEADVKFNNVIVTFQSPTVVSLLGYNLILHDLESASPFRRLNSKQQESALFREVDKDQAIKVFRNKLESMSMLTSFKPDEKKLLEYLALYGYDYPNLSAALLVQRLQRTDYIQIDFTSENPELSAFVVNTAFLQFIRYYQNVRSNKNQGSIDTLQNLVERRKQELDAKNAQLRSEGLIDVGQENSSKLEMIMNLQTSLTEEQSRQTQRNYDLEKINQRLTALGVSANPTATPTKPAVTNDELLKLRADRDEAYKAYINSGSSDQALLKKYNDLNSEYTNKVAQAAKQQETVPSTDNNGTGETRGSLMNKKNDLLVDIRAGEANINSIQNKIDGLQANLVKDGSKAAVVATLLKEAELANKEYLNAKQKYSDAIDINTSSVNNFRQILYGQPAIEPEPSKRMIIVGMAGAAAFIITILVLILLTYLDNSIKTPAVFARTVGLKLISMINFMNLKQKDLQLLITERDTIPDELANKRHNVFRESLRKLRYEIENSGKKIFLFASTKKGEGKTTLIQALSYSMSLSKKRILIIDTNFCNNDLTLQLNGDPILEKIHPDKHNTRNLIEQVKNAAKDVGAGTIFLIGSEGGDYTPSEILPRENLLQHLSNLTIEYDYIFLEGPPLNDFSDAKELSQYVDGVIAIFSAKHIIKQIDRQSMTFFSELNGKFVGAVLNMVDLENVNAS